MELKVSLKKAESDVKLQRKQNIIDKKQSIIDKGVLENEHLREKSELERWKKHLQLQKKKVSHAARA